jgi:diguanylate cyclase (GGDEF)-like protein
MMPTAIPRPFDEAQRLAAMRRYQLLDTPAEEDFDFLAEMASAVCGAPYSFVTLVDENRVFIKSAIGLSVGREAPRDDQYCSWAILEPQILEIPDLALDPRTAGMAPTIVHGYRSYAGVNLQTPEGFRIGTLCVLDSRPRELSAEQMRKLQRLARQVMALIELRAKQRDLQAALELAERLSREDELTGLFNRRAVMQSLDGEVARARRYGGSLSVLMVDVDHFKRVNDTFGHPVGDEVLRQLGSTMTTNLRRADVAGRYGGEEFVVVLPETPSSGAIALAEQLRQRIGALKFEEGPQKITISIGIAGMESGDHADTLLQAADEALYRAKQDGRDRVEVARGRQSHAA